MTAAAARIRQAEIKDKFGRDHKESLSSIFFLLEFERRGTKRPREHGHSRAGLWPMALAESGGLS